MAVCRASGTTSFSPTRQGLGRLGSITTGIPCRIPCFARTAFLTASPTLCMSQTYLYHGAFIECEIRNCTTIGVYRHEPQGPGVRRMLHSRQRRRRSSSTPAVTPRCAQSALIALWFTTIPPTGLSGPAATAAASWHSISGTQQLYRMAQTESTSSATQSTGQILFLFNTIAVSNGGYGVNANNVTTPVSPWVGPLYGGASNAYYGNTSGARNNFPSLPGDVTLTGSPFTNPSGGDFTLNNTAGAGAACKGAGFPSSLP